MQSHLYLNFANWDKVIESNEIAINAADKFCNYMNQSTDCDTENKYHALEWRHYGLLMKRDRKSLNDLERIVNDSKHNSNLTQWKYRMYARQQQVMPNDNILPFSDTPPPHITNGNPAWDTYSESGALVAYCLHCLSTNKSIPPLSAQFAKIHSQTSSVSTYIQNLVKIDELQYEAIQKIQNNDPKAGLKLLKLASEIEYSNKKNPDSPTLPVIPALGNKSSNFIF